MSTKTLLFALLALGLVVMSRRMTTRRAAGSGSAAHAGLPATGADSPNAAERLQATQAQGAFAGIGVDQDFSDRRNDQDAPIVPGLPDQFRGA